MNASNPFRYDLRDNVSVAAGVVATVTLPVLEQYRYLYCFHDTSTYTGYFSADYESWIHFYKAGALVAEIPAALSPVSNSRIGAASYKLAVNNGAGTGISGPSVLWWNPADSFNTQMPIHPFQLIIDADEVRLEHNQTATVRTLLAVLSMALPK
jgi:hypothetical protein